MRKIILDTAQEWKSKEPYVGKEIIKQIIDTIEIEEMKDKLGMLMDKENNKKRQNISIDMKQHMS